MEAYSGFEPQVGEIAALRTFRIGAGGVLYPLFGDRSWSDGVNTAQCRAHFVADGTSGTHPIPDAACTCGFYAYATEPATLEYPNARHVLAVISCWGRVIAGTRGIRAEYARVDAIWMSDAVPPGLAKEVAARYPSTTVYADKEAMLAEHPPTVLDCYELHSRQRTATSIALRLAILVALVVGCLPATWLDTHSDAQIVWASELCFFLVAGITRRTRTDPAAKRQSLLFIAVALWLFAPYAGVSGTLLLRLPLIQMTALTVFQRHLLAREASRFPAQIGQHSH
ncbi:MAG: hypothetical protein JWO57_943 [Pseudonocardiales bacterium]|nr:hypothetical protein [Pseudonocardiales bacterium]